jgi:hypothetical protein
LLKSFLEMILILFTKIAQHLKKSFECEASKAKRSELKLKP